MGITNCSKPQQTSDQNNQIVANQNNICCCMWNNHQVTQENPQHQPNNSVKGAKSEIIVHPIQFSQGNEPQNIGSNGYCPYFCSNNIKNQIQSMKQAQLINDQDQLPSAERFFVKTGSTNQKQQNSQVLPKFNQLKEEQNLQNQQEQVSTKKEVDNQPKRSLKLIIRTGDSNTISRYYNGSQIRMSKLQIPFQVIKLSLHNHLISGLQSHLPDFLTKYSDKSNPRNSLWRMLKNGTYTNILQNLHGIFITRDKFYEGYFVHKNPNDSTSISPQNITYIPDESGLYIDKQIIYKGQLRLGKANGIGTLYNRNSVEVFSGQWCEGVLVNGKYQSDSIYYEGEFYNNLPSGMGLLKIKNKGVTYKGVFMEGLFQDQNGIYESERYVYQGGFSSGRKFGKGILHNFKEKFKIEGQWFLDKIKDPAITKL